MSISKRTFRHGIRELNFATWKGLDNTFIIVRLPWRGLQFPKGGVINIQAASHIKRTYGAI
jgi:hypothetical protein